jgi:hypothetical protein
VSGSLLPRSSHCLVRTRARFTVTFGGGVGHFGDFLAIKGENTAGHIDCAAARDCVCEALERALLRAVGEGCVVPVDEPVGGARDAFGILGKVQEGREERGERDVEEVAVC